jgi:hypothetical protein
MIDIGVSQFCVESLSTCIYGVATIIINTNNDNLIITIIISDFSTKELLTILIIAGITIAVLINICFNKGVVCVKNVAEYDANAVEYKDIVTI